MMSELYVVGTPIGNLQDFSPRAVEVLRSVDFIAAEDTRVTGKLCHLFEIHKPMISYYAHNLRERGQYIVDRILQGERCAVVSDAGMPCISDPGEDLVKLCVEAGIPVRVVPGPNAALSALVISGLSASRFVFEGFLSTSNKHRNAHLEEIATETKTMLFYEAPHKLIHTLQDFVRVLGADRPIAVCRELTKLYEEVRRTTVGEALSYYEANAPKGEFVLVVAGKPMEELRTSYTKEQATELAKGYVAKGEKATQAAKLAAKETGFSKSEIYRWLLEQED